MKSNSWTIFFLLFCLNFTLFEVFFCWNDFSTLKEKRVVSEEEFPNWSAEKVEYNVFVDINKDERCEFCLLSMEVNKQNCAKIINNWKMYPVQEEARYAKLRINEMEREIERQKKWKYLSSTRQRTGQWFSDAWMAHLYSPSSLEWSLWKAEKRNQEIHEKEW